MKKRRLGWDRGEEALRIYYWNVAGLMNKYKETWDYRFDVDLVYIVHLIRVSGTIFVPNSY